MSRNLSALPNDLSAFWMPFSANSRFKARPRAVVSARGMYYQTTEGKQVLDGTAGLWCVGAGHGRPEIARAVTAQMEVLDYAPSFQIGHAGPFVLASRLAALAPGHLDHVFLTNSGSEAVDTALKIAIAYHRARGEGQRSRLVGRERAYHGANIGGLAVSGIGANRRQFGALLAGVDHLPHTHDLTRQAFSRGQPTSGAERAEALEDLASLHGGENIAAVIVEPVTGAGGVLVPPVGYLQRLREICTRHGILLIFDEVVTGFGRTGTGFAAESFAVEPDMIVFAKAVTNAVIPLGGVIASRAIHDALMRASDGIELFHGYTYSGHPIASAAANATLSIYETDQLFERVRQIAPLWEAALHGLAGLPHVIDVRNLGLLGAVELSPLAEEPGARGAEVHQACWDQGILVRASGDTLVLSPPLIITIEEIGRIVETIAAILPAIR
jgi:beta-alanine--pyruvate transaminase